MPIKRILVAEDEKALARTLKLKLESAGFVVTVVFDGEEVFKELNHNHYDLLVLDLVMPGLDGFGVLARLKQHGVKMQVMVLSNLSQPEDLQRVVGLGAGHYLIKSETPIKEVVNQISQILA